MEISTSIHLLGDILGGVISELESPELFKIEEGIRAAAKERRGGDTEAAKQLAAAVESLDVNAARVISSSFATYFDLVNLAEENERVQSLREREIALDPKPINESVGQAIELLKKDGVTPEQMQSLLDQLNIELVLTAHPTEARRRTIVSKLQRLTHLLDQLSSQTLSQHDQRKFVIQSAPRSLPYG